MGPALLIMGFTSLLCFVVVYKLVKAQQAAHWPSVGGLILKSGTAKRDTSSQPAAEVKTVAALQYKYQVAGVTYHGTQIRAGDRFGTVPGPEILNRFPKGTNVPVYYNPARPAESVLEIHLPYSVAGAWAFAAAVFMCGVGASLIFTHLDTLMEKLRRIFPQGAEPQGVIFFGLCSLWTLFMIWDNRRQANRAGHWPTVEGVVAVSKAEGFRTTVGAAREGTRVTMYQPVVEYSYLVEGREYYSRRVSFGADIYSQAQEQAAQRAARYPAGTKVAVHYNPQHPEVAVLETTVAFRKATFLFLALFLGLTLFFSGLRP